MLQVWAILHFFYCHAFKVHLQMHMGLCSINTIQLLHLSWCVLHRQWKRVSKLIWNPVPHIGSGLENLTDSSLSTEIHKAFFCKKKKRQCWGWTTVPCQLIWKAKVKMYFSQSPPQPPPDLDLLHLNLHFGYTMTSTMKLTLSSSTMKPSGTFTS